MGLETVRSSFCARVLMHRRISRLIHSTDFAIAYKHATEKEKQDIEKAVVRLDKVALDKFIKGHLLKLTPFHRMTVKQLRKIARNIRLPVYWEKDKLTLIEDIEDVIARLKKGGK